MDFQCYKYDSVATLDVVHGGRWISAAIIGREKRTDSVARRVHFLHISRGSLGSVEAMYGQQLLPFVFV